MNSARGTILAGTSQDSRGYYRYAPPARGQKRVHFLHLIEEDEAHEYEDNQDTTVTTESSSVSTKTFWRMFWNEPVLLLKDLEEVMNRLTIDEILNCNKDDDNSTVASYSTGYTSGGTTVSSMSGFTMGTMSTRAMRVRLEDDDDVSEMTYSVIPTRRRKSSLRSKR